MFANQLSQLRPFAGEKPVGGLILEPHPTDEHAHVVVVFAEDHEKIQYLKGYADAVEERNHGKIDSAGGRI